MKFPSTIVYEKLFTEPIKEFTKHDTKKIYVKIM